MLLKLLHEILPEIERIGIEAEERGKKLGIQPSWSKTEPKTVTRHFVHESTVRKPTAPTKVASR